MNAAPWATTFAPQAAAPVVIGADELALKHEFAEALLKLPNDPFRAACGVFGNDTVKALEVANRWPFDLVVLQRQAELLDKFGPEEFLPTKTDVARRIWNCGEAATDTKDKLAAYRLYAELRGFVPKGDAAGVNVTVNNNRVMVVPAFGTDDQWETNAARQQSKLIEHSRD